MEYSTIRYLPPNIEGDTVHWTGEFTGAGGRSVSVYFNFTCPDAVSFTPRIRPFLLAFLVPAMRIGHPLQLDQPLDQTTLDNLMEWQCAMAGWLPRQLKVIPIRCPIQPEPPKPPEAQDCSLTAFSAGVDSCFTAFQHSVAARTGKYRHTRLGAGLMVHGFDIPESQTEVFDRAFARSAQVLQSLGLRAYQLRTNVRSLTEIFGCDWEYETHGIWVAAALSCLEPSFDRVLIPSSYSYEILRLPWGSNPATDAFFSSGVTPFWHDGAAWHKLTKVQAMAQHSGIQRGLRVCWEGSQLDRNCGLCFKCVATQVCYWLSGVANPECFPVSCELKAVARTPLKNDQNHHLFEMLHAGARRQGKTGLSRALASALARNTRQRLRRKLKRFCLPQRSFLNSL